MQLMLRGVFMKKAIVFVILAFLLPAIAFPQNAVTIDVALSNSTTYFSNILPANTKVVVLNCTSKWPDLSDYIIEELIGYIVNERKLTVVDRQNLENIRREMDFQLSGAVSDETAQSIGKMLGAQTIISGSITAIGNTYRLRVRAISVETAQILGMQNVDVAQDSRIAALTGTAYTGPAAAAITAAPRMEITTSNTAPADSAATVSASDTDSRYFNFKTAVWSHNTGPKSYVNSGVLMQNIGGLEKQVLSINGILPKDGGWLIVEAFDRSIIQKLTQGQGVRFKVLGDGKPWQLLLITRRTIIEQISFRGSITTKNNSVVEIDIPYSRLRQPPWERKTVFERNSILGLGFSRDSETRGVGDANIKIFDLEIY
jgi:TolB-like protein